MESYGSRNGVITMKSKRHLATFIIVLVITLVGCNKTNQEAAQYPTYEELLIALDSQQGQNKLLQSISIEKMNFNLEAENEIEKRMDFTFLIKNITDEKMKISYVGYFPIELESYYLSRSKIELEQVDLSPNQVVDATQSILVAYEEKLSTIQRQFLQKNGHVMYFAISIDGKLNYVKVQLDDLGFQK